METNNKRKQFQRLRVRGLDTTQPKARFRGGFSLFLSDLCIKEKVRRNPIEITVDYGGPEEIRTLDPHNANVMRSQLRYRPVCILKCRIPIIIQKYEK